MTHIEWEWIFAHALFAAGKIHRNCLIHDTLLNFGDAIMRKCKTCGRPFYGSCIDCSFRNGGKIVEDRETQSDLLHEMHMNLHRDYLENALEWMRVIKEM
jgi:hypothetical protein